MSNAGDGDKRKVSTDALETLGTIIGVGEKRDAIHLAVEPMVATVVLNPGQHVTAKGLPAIPSRGVGIVDPFLIAPVQPGERFWLVVYPRMIHSLRHVWTHPEFHDEPEVAALNTDNLRTQSEAWMRAEAERLDTGYHALIEAARNFVKYGDYFVEGGKFEGESLGADFWTHWERITGESAGDAFGEHFLSCSC